MVGSGIASYSRTDGCEVRVETSFRRDRKIADIIGPDSDKRAACYKSWTRKEFPAKSAKKLSKVRLPCLFKREPKVCCSHVAVYIVIYVAVGKTRCKLVRIFFEEELATHGEALTAIICKKPGYPYNRGRRYLVIGTKREDIA